MTDTERIDKIVATLKGDEKLLRKLATHLYDGEIDWEIADEFMVPTFGELRECSACGPETGQMGYPGCPCPECGEEVQ